METTTKEKIKTDYRKTDYRKINDRKINDRKINYVFKGTLEEFKQWLEDSHKNSENK